ncbi:hypothetical protein RND81_03G136300 [Saponaria officinalis]|uniref:Cytochrome P450 n=1 Tax=Saponaria officinalis TaxID=3572 RepID=A0AAW1M7K8_SAPOF
MRPCDTQFTLLLNFVARRLQSHSSALDSSACDADVLSSQEILKDYAIREINILLWFALFVITAVLLKKLFFVFKIWAYGCQIPGPPSPSFCGHSTLFCSSDSQFDLTEFLVESHKKYGSMVRLWLSPTQLLVSIKEPSLINEMLSKAGDKMPLIGRVYRLAFGQSRFFVSSFEKVKRSRDILACELNGKLLEKSSIMTDRVINSVMERTAGIMEKGALDCEMFSQHMAFSILGATLFGDAFFAWSKANAYEELLLRIAKDACFWASYSVPPFWKRGYWKYQRLCIKLKSLTEDVVQHSQLNKLLSPSNGYINTEMPGAEASSDSNISCIDKIEKASSEESCCPLNLKEEPCGNVMGMMFHGCLTTAGQISNILARLGMHPEMQHKIYSEVIMVRRRSDKSTKLDVREMHLLLATIYESARLLPAGPLLQRCLLRQDLKLKNGVVIPAGALLVAPVELVQMDENNWGSDAGVFNPYRFLSKVETASQLDRRSKTTDAVEVPVNSGVESYNLNDPYKNAAYLPFGSGLRACVGQKFAVLGIASILASLLEHYEIKLVPEPEIEPRLLMVNCVLQLVPSPKIVFVRRNA